ncbi:hypothetical protein MPTK1_5g08990 [Marchantia polymorpha subsp. ruderalis]|uniref:Methyltransferase FkbM domain-containing protein n=2 Tax=Marchantia polymorpha TaxID=3197 RepID=A0AAF6BGG0_MARPO|nr:hypothetical protein MARPO_0095s0059 [Marchantia polymorpha]BBN11094.1 hypothetical protein Mp_5g08990 [Marchantia polymorpha subsp. ruderalis]|eukprot:PTQ32803.1 hypothetical protein MARPO_0095s0059 [Marchantia polymorpha]
MALLKRSSPSSFSPVRYISLPGLVIWVMVTYIAVDLGMHLSSSEHGRVHKQVMKELQSSLASRFAEKAAAEDESKLLRLDGEEDEAARCNSVEAHMDVFEGQARKPQDPWNQLKWGLPPADCRVKGHLIERLDPLNNYRRGVALGFTTDLDDKTQIEHWFLGTKEDLNQARRRVFIDLGANYFTSSVMWFMHRYPCDFTEVHAFEADPTLFKFPPGWDEERNWVEPERHGWAKIKSRAGHVPSWLLSRIRYYNKFAGVIDNASSVNITRFMKHELKLKPEDTVIVKMDIEGAEWPILREWIQDPDMPKLVDELFVELHYWHPDNNWESVKQWTREDATRMLADLRLKGFYAHYWD